jgi:ABC-type polysaccharide/polyol phosphate transport system ATPase subunit
MTALKVELRNVTVEYELPAGYAPAQLPSRIRGATGGHVFGHPKRSTRVRALDGVTFSLAKGERLGLVGGNGAGKSTLLKTIAGCLEPVAGEVDVEGRISTLLHIGAGMDLESTGRQNIITMGLHLLMLPRDVAPLIDDIVEFAELGEFIDLPLRIYSDGMRMRLAFAVATSLQPEILLLDEGIGAGDARFAERARLRAEQLYARAGILVLASHNATLLRQFCTRALWLDGGKVMAHGEIETVLAAYAEQRRAS